MATTADFRNGLCIAFRNDICTIVSFQHVKPGKGSAFVRTKLKSISTGKIIENTFRAGAKITTVRVEKRPCQFLYQDNAYVHFMHQETFEPIALPQHQVPCSNLLKDGVSIDVIFRADTDEVLACEPPASFLLRITHTEAGAKGNTATQATKHATLETGIEIQVPLFIKEGDLIKVDSTSHTYISREKQ